jgi:hypothetical protein
VGCTGAKSYPDVTPFCLLLNIYRYASKPWMERLKQVNSSRQIRLAGHLCSTRLGSFSCLSTVFLFFSSHFVWSVFMFRCAQVLAGDGSYVQSLHEEVHAIYICCLFCVGRKRFHWIDCFFACLSVLLDWFESISSQRHCGQQCHIQSRQ